MYAGFLNKHATVTIATAKLIISLVIGAKNLVDL